MNNPYNLYPLHVFRVVALFGSVTQAAQELCISQPAVSFHIKSLEIFYHETLFDRTPRGMFLTPAGIVVSEQANRVFALLNEIPSTIETTRSEVKGDVTLASSSTPAAYLVPPLLRRFQDLYPYARPKLIVGDSKEAISWLHDYKAHIGVVGETLIAESLISEEIGRDELRLVAAGSDSFTNEVEITGKSLSGRTLFLREKGSSTRAGAEEMLCGMLKEFKQVVELKSTETIKRMTAAGLGVAVLSSWTTELEEKAHLLSPVQDTRFRKERPFYIVRRKDRPFTGILAALWQSLTEKSVSSASGESG